MVEKLISKERQPLWVIRQFSTDGSPTPYGYTAGVRPIKVASYGCFSIQNKSTSHRSPVTGHSLSASPGTRHQSPVTGHPGMDKITGHFLPVTGHPVTGHPGTGHLSRVLVSGHCDGLLVTPTGHQLRVLVSGHCVALLVTPTGQQLRVLVSSHCVELLVTSPGNSYEY